MRLGLLRAGNGFAVITLLTLAACSLANAPDDVKAGAGGSTATTTTTSTGGDDACKTSADCKGDDDLCDNVFECKGGQCIDDVPVELDDGDPCTKDTCDKATGVSHTPLAGVDDGDACTEDTCDATGTVHHDALTPQALDDQNPCTVDACDPMAGVTHSGLPELDDGNQCTFDDCKDVQGQPDVTHIKLKNCDCTHSACTLGGALDAKACSWGGPNEMDDCVAKVCSANPSCCDVQNGVWDTSCIDAVSNVCPTGQGNFVCGQCPHSYCNAGSALFAACDPCVKRICESIPHCCDPSGSWDDECIAATHTLCNVPSGPACQ